jgi:hypothetical protein
MPFAPFKVSLDCTWPNWSRAEKAGAFCPTSNPIEGGAGWPGRGLFCAKPSDRKQLTKKMALVGVIGLFRCMTSLF